MFYLFVHGLGQTAASWDKTVGALDGPLDFACPDLPKLAAGAAGYSALYRAFSQYCDRLEAPLCLCGLSLGGVLSLHYCIEHPRRGAALVLIGTPYKMPKGLLKLQNLLFSCMPPTAFAQTGFGKKDFLALCRSMAALDFSGELHRISCPVLAVCGQKDQPNRKAAEELARILPGANLRIIPGAGHEVNVDQPGLLAAELEEFYANTAK